MDATEWAYGLSDLPDAFADWPEKAKRVARAVYNAYLYATGNKSRAVAKTIANLTARGLSSTGEFPHEEPS